MGRGGARDIAAPADGTSAAAAATGPAPGPGGDRETATVPGRSAPATDAALVDRVRAGDPAAFTELARRYSGPLLSLCTRLLNGDRHLAEDIVQETMIKLAAVLDRDVRPLRVWPWLTVVARNACYDEWRRKVPTPVEALPEQPVEDEDPFAADPALERAWAALLPRHREALYYRELLGHSYDEIATLLSTSVAAVETLLFRARAALRREYTRAGGELLGCGALGLGVVRYYDTAGATSARAAAHLATCGRCTDALHRLHGVTALLRGAGAGTGAGDPAGVGRARPAATGSRPGVPTTGHPTAGHLTAGHLTAGHPIAGRPDAPHPTTGHPAAARIETALRRPRGAAGHGAASPARPGRPWLLQPTGGRLWRASRIASSRLPHEALLHLGSAATATVSTSVVVGLTVLTGATSGAGAAPGAAAPTAVQVVADGAGRALPAPAGRAAGQQSLATAGAVAAVAAAAAVAPAATALPPGPPAPPLPPPGPDRHGWWTPGWDGGHDDRPPRPGTVTVAVTVAGLPPLVAALPTPTGPVRVTVSTPVPAPSGPTSVRLPAAATPLVRLLRAGGGPQ